MTGDEELLDLLRRSLRPADVEPPPASLAALARAVADSRQPTRATSRWKPRLIVAGAILAVGGSGTATAVAAGAVGLPAPVRALAHGVGLPVDSVELVRAKADAARLRVDLRQGDRTQVVRDAWSLETRFDRLGRGEQHGMDAEVDGLLQQAARYGDDGSPQSRTPPPAERAGQLPGDGDDAGAGIPDSGHTGSSPTTISGVEGGEGSAVVGSDTNGGPATGSSGGTTQQTGEQTTTTTPQPSMTGGGDVGGGSGDTSPTTAVVAPTTTVATAGDGGGGGDVSGGGSGGSSDGGMISSSSGGGG